MWLAAPEGVFPEELAPDLGLILDSVPDGVYAVDPTGRIIDASLALVMIGAAINLAGDHDALAGFALALGAIILVSVAFIEPATTRAAGLHPDQ